jgi:hypothetical protein
LVESGPGGPTPAHRAPGVDGCNMNKLGRVPYAVSVCGPRGSSLYDDARKLGIHPELVRLAGLVLITPIFSQELQRFFHADIRNSPDSMGRAKSYKWLTAFTWRLSVLRGRPQFHFHASFL